MEIIEKQVEKVKEVPYDGYGYYPRDRYATKGVAGTGLGLGIAGTALGLLALSRGGFSLFGNGISGLSMPENVNINALGGGTAGNGVSAPTAFQAWEKGCITEMMENLMNTNPFTFKTSFIGDIEIGGGEIKFNLPFTSKRLVLNITDLETFKEMLITKS